MEKTRVDFLVQWQSLVAPPYRTVWRELNKQLGWRVTMVAPTSFREGGMQEITCAPNAAENPTLVILPVRRWHTQVVWFRGLTRTLARWLREPADQKIFLCFAEPYAVTALLGWLALWGARVLTMGQSPRPKILLFGFQNIFKRFSLPIRLIQALMFRVCDGVFVAGVEHEDVIRRHGYRGACIRFPMWIDPKLYGSVAKPAGSKIRIGYAGSLLPEKGIAEVLDALIANPDVIKHCALDIAGGGPLAPAIISKVEELKVKGLDANYLGAIAVEKMPDFYRNLDLLIVPSLTKPHWKEQFGRVIIEAMACGCLVIGSDSGEIPHVINDQKRVFPEGNMQAMLTVLQEAQNDILRDRDRLRQFLSDQAIQRFADYNVAAGIAENLSRALV